MLGAAASTWGRGAGVVWALPPAALAGDLEGAFFATDLAGLLEAAAGFGAGALEGDLEAAEGLGPGALAGVPAG